MAELQNREGHAESAASASSLLKRHRSLIAYLALLAMVCAGFTWTALALGKSANLVAAFYMLTPALAAAVVRLFVHPQRFRDAALRPGPLRRYLWLWLGALGLVAVQYAAFLGAGAASLELTGQGFLAQIDAVMPGGSEQMLKQLPAGLSLRQMLALYTGGGLTLFNLPGIVLGFGEEFGWRGLMFPQLYRIWPRASFVVGGLIWFGWHLPLALLGPSKPFGLLAALDAALLAVGAVATFVLFAWLFAWGGSIWVPSLFHAVLNNGSRALSYWMKVENQLGANALLSAVMVLAVVLLWRTGQLRVFARWNPDPAGAGGASAA